MFEWVNQYFKGDILDNSPSHIATFLALVLVGILFKGVLAPLVIRVFSKILMRKTETNLITSFVLYTKNHLSRLLVFLFIYVAFNQLRFPKSWNLAPSKEFGLQMILHKCYRVFLVILGTILVLRVISFWGNYFQEKAKYTESKIDDHLTPFFKEITKVLAIILILFFTLSYVLDFNVTTLVAGLGIGGLAVALAGKETLENLFASFTIFLDKPFITGDLVQVGGILGRVEKVGFRTTRIRTVERSLITLPNKMMIDQPLDNWNERHVWRSRFDIEITYQTPIINLQEIKSHIHHYLQKHSKTDENSHVFFSEFGTNAVKMTIFFFAITNDFFEYMSIKDEINFKIYEIVKQNGGEFALPTRVVKIESDDMTHILNHPKQ
ncbi:MAG: mechanosensitive ion channel family protein [Raineya sp.]|jgi:MscS family membrane protein|nr:mechanosensitive ion channel family protein [Raineya sp.]